MSARWIFRGKLNEEGKYRMVIHSLDCLEMSG